MKQKIFKKTKEGEFAKPPITSLHDIFSSDEKYPCQQLLGGRGEAIYSNIDGMCTHPECNPENQ